MIHERAGPGSPESLPRATRRMMIELLNAAIMAPSMRGTQAWRYRAHLDSQTIELYADRERTRRYGDPSGRAVHIACGAALFNLRLAAAVAGWQPVLQLLPDPGEPRLLATVRLAGPHHAQRDEHELHAAIFQRCTSRLPPAAPLVPSPVLAEFAEAATLEGVLLTFPEHEESERLPHLVFDAERTEAGVARRAGLSRSAVLSTHSDGRLDWLRAGQALQRILLTAAIRGTTVSFPDQLLETADPRLAQDPPLTGMRPQFVLRFGYAPLVPAEQHHPVPAPRDHRAVPAAGPVPAPAAGSAGPSPRVTGLPGPAGR